MDLIQLLKRPEGKTLEFKREISTPEAALKTIVAFANTAGGILLLGVEDKSRHVRGVPDPLDLEERLANLAGWKGRGLAHVATGWRWRAARSSFAVGGAPRPPRVEAWRGGFARGLGKPSRLNSAP